MGNGVNDYVAGTAAGCATVLVGHPFDTVKVRLQTQHSFVHSVRYRGALHCCAHILKMEGVTGLYKGATPSFVGVSFESALLFGAYSQMKSNFQGGDASSPLLTTVLPAAALAGAGISVILCPTELVKCRLQVQDKAISTSSMQQYRGPVDCVRTTIKKEGVQGLFRGAVATCFRESLGNACFFCTYETTRAFLLSSFGLHMSNTGHGSGSPSPTEQNSSRGSMQSVLVETGVGIVSGGLSGVAFWSVVLPIDVAKTRIQVARDPTASRSIFHHLGVIYKELGIRGLYAGLGPTLSRAFPANAAAMVMWELTASLLGGHQ